MPVRSAAPASASVIAGSTAMLRVPRRMLRLSTASLTGLAMPTSTATTSAPAMRAMRQTLESPLAAFSATIAVTSCPVCVTPSATTPLSAHIISTARRPSVTSAVPVMPAIFTTASSKSPKLCSGFATISHRSLAVCIAVSSGGQIALRISSSVKTHASLFHAPVTRTWISLNAIHIVTFFVENSKWGCNN